MGILRSITKLLKTEAEIESPTDYKVISNICVKDEGVTEDDLEDRSEDLDVEKFDRMYVLLDRVFRQIIKAKNMNGEQFGKGRLISPDQLQLDEEFVIPMLGHCGELVVFQTGKMYGNNVRMDEIATFSGQKEKPLKQFLWIRMKNNDHIEELEKSLIKML